VDWFFFEGEVGEVLGVGFLISSYCGEEDEDEGGYGRPDKGRV